MGLPQYMLSSCSCLSHNSPLSRNQPCYAVLEVLWKIKICSNKTQSLPSGPYVVSHTRINKPICFSQGLFKSFSLAVELLSLWLHIDTKPCQLIA
ncbi:uncharacterized protein M6B38_276580 [Iris pallida]|uniref:Uncharacterized protein n=1 Tax=Iris pallida TaxID=29817 RepID=A0AAX6I408_IRIPA|nr:uncharacterized protein M6B38_276580 [Iris pallida]